MCLTGIELWVQNPFSILDSIVNIIGGDLHDHLLRKKINFEDE